MAGQAYVEQVLSRRRKANRRTSLTDRLQSAREAAWNITVRALERFSGYRRGLGNRDFHLTAEVRDLVVRKTQRTRDEMEALIASVMRAGSYTREEASRAVRAVMAALSEREKYPDKTDAGS